MFNKLVPFTSFLQLFKPAKCCLSRGYSANWDATNSMSHVTSLQSRHFTKIKITEPAMATWQELKLRTDPVSKSFVTGLEKFRRESRIKVMPKKENWLDNSAYPIRPCLSPF